MNSHFVCFQYEEAVDAELAWVAETERKLTSLGPLSLEPDVTVAQLQVQRAFNIDIIRHKDTVDQLLATRDDIVEACSDTQKDVLIVSVCAKNVWLVVTVHSDWVLKNTKARVNLSLEIHP